MSVTYKFSSLASMADYLDNFGRNIAERAAQAKPKEAALLKREAVTYQFIADFVRSTVIEGAENTVTLDARSKP